MEDNEIHGSFFCPKEELDLKMTLKGGQSFRWELCKDGLSYRGVFHQSVWTLFLNENKLLYNMHGTLKKDFNCNEVLSTYFQLHISLVENLKSWVKADTHFETSYNDIKAVRILNQDIIENLFSFICSSNNNITRISGMVTKLCKLFGKKICEVENKEYYDFPTIEELANAKVESVLRTEGFGYRAKYISDTAKKLLALGGRIWLLNLKKENGMSYQNARQNLMSLPGIGPKVADCICLMSLGHLEAIPVDTHIFQIACTRYTPHLSKCKSVTPKIHEEISSYLRELWGPLAGWTQAIVFSMKINSVSNNKPEKCTLTKRKKTVSKQLNNKVKKK